ncbi:hypothetical protein ERD78_14180 [Allopusillimonas soli]|uniref:Phytanoyl-CoA dioxygenase n=1 Tax=Allopusillimonas soli TaxID=659016 RepID=A0A853FJA5_9BURK|nr:hypothetical protein [Allopusillimonas soli]NYT38026.1 hypothetical protein [Allopusillimonas soli]TEA73918.1 hypothetical protein ERD78_14180 [Allopusillimonas soli]
MAISHIIRNFRKHPRYTLMRAVARFENVRQLVTGARSRFHAGGTRRLLADCEQRMEKSIFKDADLHRIVADLQQNGVAFGLRLPDAMVEDLCDFARNEPCYAFRNPDAGFYLADRENAEERLNKPILLAQYFNTSARSSAVASLRDDPALLWIAASFLGSIPRFVGANMWWTFPVNASDEDRHKHAHFFHRDVDDFRFFKFFFYLTDVPAGDGGHVCVATSHNAQELDMKRLRRFSDAEVLESYGTQNVIEISGKAGTGFAENTLCIHKGRTPTDRPRLLLQLQYALFDYGVMNDEKNQRSLRMIT